jgi:hypothetical protein
MKALLGASSLAVIAAISLTPAAQAQEQPGTMPGTMNAAPPQPGVMSSVGQPAVMAPAPQQYPPQNAYAPAMQGETQPSELHQVNPRYPGPKLN